MTSDKTSRDKIERQMQKCEQYVKLVDAMLNIIDVARPLAGAQYDDDDERRRTAHDDWLTIVGDIKSLRAESVDHYEDLADTRNRLTKKIEATSGC